MTVINQTEEVVEIPAAEYKAIKAVAAGIAEQNQLVLESVKAMSDAVMQNSMQMQGAFQILADALSRINVVVNVPEQPAPIVNITNQVPEQPAPVVNVNTPPEQPKEIDMKMSKNPKGEWILKGREK